MIKDGLSFGAWMARGDPFLAYLVLFAFLIGPCSVCVLGLLRFLRGEKLLPCEESTEVSVDTGLAASPDGSSLQSGGSSGRFASELPEVEAGPAVHALFAMGALSAVLTHGWITLMVLIALQGQTFSVRHAVLGALVVLAWASGLAWLPTLSRERLWWGRRETQERVAFWTLFGAETGLTLLFVWGS